MMWWFNFRCASRKLVSARAAASMLGVIIGQGTMILVATLDIMRAEHVAITVVALLIGGIAITNCMMVSVLERSREIAVQMRAGWRRSDVRKQWLLESVLLSIAGGLIGTIAGLTAAHTIARLTARPVTTPHEAIVTALGLSIVLGVVCGFLPARKAASIDPTWTLQ